MFVCLEGVDGVGKSTIAANVRKAFTLNNVILCSDPCKEHPATLALRQFLLSRGNSLPVATQIKLFDAAREILIFSSFSIFAIAADAILKFSYILSFIASHSLHLIMTLLPPRCIS